MYAEASTTVISKQHEMFTLSTMHTSFFVSPLRFRKLRWSLNRSLATLETPGNSPSAVTSLVGGLDELILPSSSFNLQRNFKNGSNSFLVVGDGFGRPAVEGDDGLVCCGGRGCRRRREMDQFDGGGLRSNWLFGVLRRKRMLTEEGDGPVRRRRMALDVGFTQFKSRKWNPLTTSVAAGAGDRSVERAGEGAPVGGAGGLKVKGDGAAAGVTLGVGDETGTGAGGEARGAGGGTAGGGVAGGGDATGGGVAGGGDATGGGVAGGGDATGGGVAGGGALTGVATGGGVVVGGGDATCGGGVVVVGGAGVAVGEEEGD
ncbi:hypothetical protein R6Q57_006301 [Mikania cordata]